MKVELVTRLKREATKILSELKRTKEPILITEHGKPSAYLVDVDDFEHMRARIAILEGIAKGEAAVAQGRIHANDEAKEKLDKWLK